MAAFASTALAQSGTNSPYSQYGLGVLSDNGTGFSRSMNGLGLGFHEHNQVNTLNPASYASIDSLSFIFDAGFSGQVTNFQENGVKKNASNADLDYVVAGFRLAKHFGVSFGVLPYTNIGYSYSSTNKLNQVSSPTTYTNTFSGTGGLHQVYLGAGFEPIKGLSVGFNLGYLWGNYDRSIINSYSNAYINTLSKYYTATVNNYKLDLGLQYTANISHTDNITLGLTYGYGHKLGADPKCQTISRNTSTGVSDTTSVSISNGLKLPTTYGVGIMYNRANKLKLGVDYSLMKYSGIGYPMSTLQSDGKQNYELVSGIYKNRSKITVGATYCPDENGRHFMDHVKYNIGASYATPYYKINEKDGPKEYGISAGFGIPIINGWNNRSYLNISGTWTKQEAVGLIKENTFRINIGFTFNERWFAKWKVQ